MAWRRNPYLTEEEEQHSGSSLLAAPPLANNPLQAAQGLALPGYVVNRAAVAEAPGGGVQAPAPARERDDKGVRPVNTAQAPVQTAPGPLQDAPGGPALAPGPMPALAGGNAPRDPGGPPPTLPDGRPNPLYSYLQTLKANGLLPPDRPTYQPSEQDTKAARMEGLYAHINNMANAMGATGTPGYMDPVAAQDSIRADRQGRLDQEWKIKVANAQALREAIPEDYAGYLAELSTNPNYQGSLTDYIRKRKEAEREPNKYEALLKAEGYTDFTTPEAIKRIKQITDAEIAGSTGGPATAKETWIENGRRQVLMSDGSVRDLGATTSKPEGAAEAEAKLRDDYAKSVKEYTVPLDAANNVFSTARIYAEPPAPGQAPAARNAQLTTADYALIYGLAKMLDPTSVVREGEFSTASNLGDMGTKLKNWWSRLESGEQLTDDQRKSIIGLARNRAQSLDRQVSRVRGDYRQFSSRAGLDPLDVMGGEMFNEGAENLQPIWNWATSPSAGTSTSTIPLPINLEEVDPNA